MVENTEQELDRILYALSDRTRRAILTRLGGAECSVTELAQPFDMSLAAVSKHIKVLEEAGLVRKRKNGRTFRCAANFASLRDVNALLEHYAAFWQDRLGALEQFLMNDSEQEKK